LVRLLDEAAFFLPAGTLESFRDDVGLSYTRAGAVLAAAAPGGLVGGLFAAAADRFSRRAIAAGGAFALAAALGAFAAGGSFAVLVGAAFVMGVASTAMVDAAEVALVDLAGDDLRRYLARSNLLATAGDIFGPALVATVAVAGFSWRAAFAAGALLMAAYGVMLAAAPLPGPPRLADAGGCGDPGGGTARRLGAVLRDPAVWVVGVVGLLMAPFDEPLLGFTIALLEQERGTSAAVATVVALFGVTGGVLSYTVLARRLEGVDDRRLLLWSATAMTAGAATIALVPPVPVVGVAAFVASVGLNLGWLALQHTSLTLRPGQVGSTKAVLGAIEFSGFWIPAAVGTVADRAGLAAAMASLAVVGALLVALIRYGPRRHGESRVL
jgi:predicted MFS family arabinose efflux permease